MVLDACGKSQMHDQDVRAFCKIDESRVRSHLVRAEDNRHIPDAYAIGECRHVAMRDSPCRHGQSVTVKDGRWFGLRYIDDTDVESDGTSVGAWPVWNVTSLSSERGPEHWKSATPLVEQARKECGEIG